MYRKFKVLTSFVFILISFDLANGVWQCTTTDQCLGQTGTICEGGRCSCPSGKLLSENGTMCIDVGPYILSPCVENHQCKSLVAGYGCNEKTGSCMCLEGFHYASGRCWPSIAFGQSCSFTEQCDGGILSLSLACKSGKCGCADGYYNRQRGECRKAAYKIGDACIVDDDCQVNGEKSVVCEVPIFSCQKKKVAGVAADALKTQLPKQLSEPSLSSDVESNMAVAVDKMAAGNIKMARVLGTKCKVDADCSAFKYTECSEYGLCICKTGYYPEDDMSMCVAELGMPASSEDYCTGRSARFVNGICDCPIGFFYEIGNRDCIKPARRFGESCQRDAACFTFGAEGRCLKVDELQACHCDEVTSVEDAERQICKLAGGIGNSCVVDSDCLETMTCQRDQCECPEGDIPAESGLNCYETNLDIGDTCQLDDQCTKTENATCISSKCACVEGFFAEDDMCNLGITGACVDDTECMVNDSFCDVLEKEPVCKCQAGFVNHSPKMCHPVATAIGDECEVDEQCWKSLGGSSATSCQNGNCTCNAMHHAREEKCYKTIKLLQLCSKSPECFIEKDIERTECRNSLCRCKLEYNESMKPESCNGVGDIKSMTAVLPIVFTIISLINFR